MSAGAMPEDLEELRERLLEWYSANHRDLPWRDTTDPYPILVAEVMSQQTQLERVCEAWEAFLNQWPTVDALAASQPGVVIGFWSDHRLGYNRRAEYLYEAACHVVEVWDGEFPTDPALLQELKGVGPYTANAVASFAFNNGNAVVDTNVKRILYRMCGGQTTDSLAYRDSANRLLPDNDSRQWNNAIMELGGTVCTQTPRCDAEPCPWRGWCEAYASGDFTAPDVPTQPAFDGSTRQFRGRIVRTVSEQGTLSIAQLGPQVKVDYDPQDDSDRDWLAKLVASLVDDGLVSCRYDEQDDLVVVPRSE